MEFNSMNVSGNGNIVSQGSGNKKECKTCKYFEQGETPYNGNCVRLLMSILKPTPKKFMVRSEFGCNLYESNGKR